MLSVGMSACRYCFAGIQVYFNESCCVSVLLGKHYSQVSCKHVCITSMLPCSYLYGDLGCLFLSPLYITATCVSFSKTLNRVFTTCAVMLKALYCNHLRRTRLYRCTRLRSQEADLSKADFGTRLRLLKQQLEPEVIQTQWSSAGQTMIACSEKNKHEKIQSSGFAL